MVFKIIVEYHPIILVTISHSAFLSTLTFKEGYKISNYTYTQYYLIFYSFKCKFIGRLLYIDNLLYKQIVLILVLYNH